VSAVVINRIRLSVPAEEVAPDIAREFPATFRALPGFEGMELVQVGPQEVVVLIHWASAEDAQRGGATIGPTLFNTWVASRAESQDRVVGGVVLTIGP
jgi:hypothetical protein